MKLYGTAFRFTSNPEEFLRHWRQKNRGVKIISVEIRFEEQRAQDRAAKPARYAAKHVIND